MTALDLRPAVGMFADIFGVPATVTPLVGSPIETTAIRINPSPGAVGSLTSRGSDQVPEQRVRLRLRRDHVATLQVGSTIVIASGPDAGTWTAERVNDLDPEWLDVVVEAG